MSSSPVRAQVFHYLGFTIAPEQNTVTCRYALDGREFTEEIRVPGATPEQWAQPAVVEAARLLFLLTGVSYYKAGAPPVIDLGEHALTARELAFLREFYIDGLGEFAFRSDPQLDLTDLEIRAPLLERTYPADFHPAPGRPLLPFGGGVDSIVSVELLRPITTEPSLFVVNRPGDTFEAIEKPAVVTGWPVVRAERVIDPQILHAAKGEFFNGHVPVTGIISAIGVLAAALGGHDAVVMSNEWSASVGTVEVDGRSINHQYSKSEAFESAFRDVLADAIGTDFQYFSLLRPYTELWIAARFAELPQYFDTFRSCNRSFHINLEHRLDHWCGRCDKCCFIDLILAPFLPAETLRAVFTRTPEPLDNPELLGKFHTLLGLSPDTKPWECVGDVHECQIAARMAADRIDRVGSPILNRLLVALGPGDPSGEAEQLMKPVALHHIPERYAPADLLV
ncbi:endonuclease domain-containing protein [Nakamurella sp. YIM 132087]|uniref:UDP-N-acetyl-alpha-D-muramoyl-L-alanyl-L-glutamate epimerase n=1 Tax=Nakamurella alba TaxID=2665158 RepID=A0A7K1FL25_9ACTN|nr:endonuclease domain-containing protein [Nakamurella alba]MTD14852.1 endonuclease domain-containing protein [Nakamurella alba]